MTNQLAVSYALCRRMAKQSASSFYYSFLLLPRAKRTAMCALYAFLRYTDDLGDSAETTGARRSALARWREALAAASNGEFEHPILPALKDTINRFSIPLNYLHAVIDGVETDLAAVRFATFAELEQYCRRVASAVGMACIHIWGFRAPEALVPADHCGMAFQLTNILRDLKEDAARDRVYLPAEDLERFGYSVADLKRGIADSRFRALLDFEIARAERYYAEAWHLLEWLDPDGKRIYSAMLSTYHGLLQRIKRGDVLSRRVSVSAWQRMRIALGTLLPGALAELTVPHTAAR